ncbi:hypothetical protein HanPI659440_Chr12g0473421 [Helianthus annuus]|nr:hypothetical protein HanPI659440_Chr12g0473421 [Helianthus annuus]
MFYSKVKLSSRVSSGDSSIFQVCSFSSSNQPPEKLRSSFGHEPPPHPNTQPTHTPSSSSFSRFQVRRNTGGAGK